LEPELEHSIEEHGDHQSQSQRTILGNGCQSFEPALDTTEGKDQMVVTNMNEHEPFLKPQGNRDSNDQVPVSTDDESEDIDDMPILSMSKMTSLFSMP